MIFIGSILRPILKSSIPLESEIFPVVLYSELSPIICKSSIITTAVSPSGIWGIEKAI